MIETSDVRGVDSRVARHDEDRRGLEHEIADRQDEPALRIDDDPAALAFRAQRVGRSRIGYRLDAELYHGIGYARCGGARCVSVSGAPGGERGGKERQRHV